MRVVILAGGRGTRISEETDVKPKPMVDVGGRPILWHIMRHYAAQGFDDFVIAAGYKADVIKRFFLDEMRLAGDLLVDTRDGRVTRSGPVFDNWRVRIVNTGLDTNTGGRILRLKPHLEGAPSSSPMATASATCREGCHRPAPGAGPHRHHHRRPPPARSAASASRATTSPALSRSRRSAKAGSMAASPSSSPASSTISLSTATRAPSKWRSTSGSPATASSAPIATTASGSASTRSANSAAAGPVGRRQGPVENLDRRAPPLRRRSLRPAMKVLLTGHAGYVGTVATAF